MFRFCPWCVRCLAASPDFKRPRIAAGGPTASMATSPPSATVDHGDIDDLRMPSHDDDDSESLDTQLLAWRCDDVEAAESIGGDDCHQGNDVLVASPGRGRGGDGRGNGGRERAFAMGAAGQLLVTKGW